MNVFFLSCFNLHCVIYGYLEEKHQFLNKKKAAYEMIHNALLKKTHATTIKKVTKLVVKKKKNI